MMLPLCAQEIYKGTLENGFTFYLAKTPSKSINIHLIQDIGAVVEEEQESGYTHFIEHMLSHSSKNFPNGGGDFLKRNNLSNNASTYKDKVIYDIKYINPAQTDVDSCILLAHDWSFFLNFNEEDIESEKNIIDQERRTGRQVNETTEEITDLLYNNTALSMTSMLGDARCVEKANSKSLKQFYDKWFVPDLQSLYIEGDIDIEEYVKKIQRCYSDVSQRQQTLKPQVVIPDNNELYFKAIPTRNKKLSNFEIANRLDVYDFTGKTDFVKKMLYARLYALIMNGRIDNYKFHNNKVFQHHEIKYSDFHLGYSTLAFNYTAYSGKEVECLQQIMANHNNIVNYGLSEQEIHLFTSDLLALVGKMNDSYQIIEDNFLKKYPLYAHEDVENVCHELRDGFDNQDFIAFCEDCLQLKNTLVVAVLHPENSYQLESRIQNVLESKDDDPKVYDNKEVVFDPIDHDVLANEKATSRGTHFKLENGLEIFYLESDDDTTIVNGFAPGGISAYGKKDIPLAESLPEIMNASNVGSYNDIDIDIYKRKNELNLSFSVDEYFNKVSAACPMAKEEKLYVLLANKIKYSVSDSSVFSRYQEVKHFRTINQQVDPIAEKINTKVFGVNTRQVFFSSLYFDKFDPAILNDEFQRIYNNGSNWCYVIESGVSVEAFKAKYIKYFADIGNVGSKQKYSVYKELKIKKDVREITPYNSPNNIGGIEYNIFLNQKLSAKEVLALHILQFVIKERCIAEFRDKRAALYGMHTEVQNALMPEDIHRLYINLGINSSNVVPFVDFVNDQLKMIRKQKISIEEISKAREVFVKRNFASVKSSLLLNDYKVAYQDGSYDGQKLKVDHLLIELSKEDLIEMAKVLDKKGYKIEYLFK